ncbi:MAG TPA: hypothetical protein VEV41_03080 [Terriglobales bacterium]|nr:hypothetical protein [Terriglobales bacterium]
MPWLVPFLTLAILFLLLAFLRFRADREGRKQCRHIVPPSNGRLFSPLSVRDAFDPDHALIWDTQIPALQLIAAAGRKGVAVKHLRPHYVQSSIVYPELYEGSSFWLWIAFLEEAQLVTFDQGRVFLTSQGAHLVKNWVGMEVSGAPTKTVA